MSTESQLSYKWRIPAADQRTENLGESNTKHSSGDEMHARVLCLLIAFWVGACSSIDSTMKVRTIDEQLKETKVDIADKKFSDDYEQKYTRFKEIYSVVHGNATSAGSIVTAPFLTEYTYAGFSYVDDKCRKYFAALHSFYKSKREAVNSTNIVTALLSGVLAATHAPASQIAIVAVGGSSAAALLDNTGSRLLFELDPATTEGMVKRASDAYRAAIANSSITTFGDALSAVQGYAGICLPSNIERQVKEAVAKANPTDLSGARPNVFRLSSNAGITGLSETLGLVTNLSPDDVARLYALFHLSGGADEDIRTLIKKDLPSGVTEKLFKAGNSSLTDDKALREKISAALEGINSSDPNLGERAAKFSVGYQNTKEARIKEAKNKAQETTAQQAQQQSPSNNGANAASSPATPSQSPDVVQQKPMAPSLPAKPLVPPSIGIP